MFLGGQARNVVCGTPSFTRQLLLEAVCPCLFLEGPNKNCWSKSASLRIIDSLIAHKRSPGSPSCWEYFSFPLFCRSEADFCRVAEVTNKRVWRAAAANCAPWRWPHHQHLGSINKGLCASDLSCLKLQGSRSPAGWGVPFPARRCRPQLNLLVSWGKMTS